jgi:hypothetical protein
MANAQCRTVDGTITTPEPAIGRSAFDIEVRHRAFGIVDIETI